MRLNSLFHLRRIISHNFQRAYKSTSQVELTQNRYAVKRGNFATIEAKDVKFFESIVGSNYTQQEDVEKYNIDFLKSVRGEGKVVLKPGSAKEISSILKYCNERKLAVCPQGGNTSLVGGSVPVFDEIILSMERLNKVISIDDITGVAVCESGCILQLFDEKVRDKGFLVPLDLGAKESCQIGGNLATNAGGLRVLRYGNLQGSVLGIEIVMANGEILDLMSHLKKDNTGYHLKHLFIGAEGTLGIITKLSILCPPVPKSIHVAFVGLNSFNNVLKTYSNAKWHLGEILSSCEMLDASSLDTCIKHFNLRCPIDKYPFYMLIETSGSNDQHDMQKFEQFLENGLNNGEIINGTVTGEHEKIKKIWKLREFVPVALVREGYCFKYDISLPLNEFYQIVEVMQKRLSGIAKTVCGYGHLGDSNLHLNITCNEYSEELHKLIEPYVFEYTSKVKGSVSAEHGIGFLKTKYLNYSKDSKAIDLMWDLKRLFDPHGILNPYKVLYRN